MKNSGRRRMNITASWLLFEKVLSMPLLALLINL